MKRPTGAPVTFGNGSPMAFGQSAVAPAVIAPAAIVVCLIALCLFPWFGDFAGVRFPTSYELRLVMRAMILAIVVIGLNILVGLAGLVSLGQAALFGLGAHVAALLALRAGFPSPPAWSSPSRFPPSWARCSPSQR
jgi:ABC-type branched-subunit amino acid transport system permease subunit